MDEKIKNYWLIPVVISVIGGIVSGLISGFIVYDFTTKPKILLRTDWTHTHSSEVNKTIYDMNIDITNIGARSENNLTVKITFPFDDFKNRILLVEPNITSCYEKYSNPIIDNILIYTNCPLTAQNTVSIKLSYIGKGTVIECADECKITYPVVNLTVIGEDSKFYYSSQPSFGTFSRFS